MIERLTDNRYWDEVWDGRTVPRPLDPTDPALNNFINVELHRYLRDVFKRVMLPGARPVRLIEAGCGGSTVLPYFHREFGFEVAGLDYSVTGCKSSRAIHAAANVPADIRHCDLFDPPTDMLAAFDLVYSAGLVEHFRPTCSVVEALSRLCCGGGYLITLVPNFSGWMGAIQKRLNRPIYDLHVPLTLDQLVAAHRDCGLEIVTSGFIGTINLGVLNFSGPNCSVPLELGQRITSWISKSVWGLRRLGLPEMPNKWLSPYIASVAQKPSMAAS